MTVGKQSTNYGLLSLDSRTHLIILLDESVRVSGSWNTDMTNPVFNPVAKQCGCTPREEPVLTLRAQDLWIYSDQFDNTLPGKIPAVLLLQSWVALETCLALRLKG